jgi:hypothetical protein
MEITSLIAFQVFLWGGALGICGIAAYETINPPKDKKRKF